MNIWAILKKAIETDNVNSKNLIKSFKKTNVILTRLLKITMKEFKT